MDRNPECGPLEVKSKAKSKAHKKTIEKKTKIENQDQQIKDQDQR